jgi:transcriptional regulator with XRE-family HTH domain
MNQIKQKVAEIGLSQREISKRLGKNASYLAGVFRTGLSTAKQAELLKDLEVVGNVVLQAKVDELQAENKILNQAAATHLRNQKHYMDLYHRLVEQLYPYAIDLEDPVDGDVNITPQEFIDGYNRARECAHYNLLEMMESDEEYIRAQCDMLGGGGEV